MNRWISERDDQREDRIRAVKDRIDRGVYRVPAAAVADGVIAWYERVDPPSRR